MDTSNNALISLVVCYQWKWDSSLDLRHKNEQEIQEYLFTTLPPGVHPTHQPFTRGSITSFFSREQDWLLSAFRRL